MMEQFGVECSFDGDSYHIKKGQQYQREVYKIEPDVSAHAILCDGGIDRRQDRRKECS